MLYFRRLAHPAPALKEVSMKTQSGSLRSISGKRGHAVTVAISTLALVVASALGVVAFGPAAPAPKAATRSFIPPAGASTTELYLALHELGLTPENLAAAGVTAQDIGVVIKDVADGLAASPEGITAAKASFAAARRTKEALVRAVQSGQAPPKDLETYAGVLHAYETAEAQLRTVRKDLWTRCIVHLSEQQRRLIETINANAFWGVSTQYLVVNRTEPQWVRLRDAWAADRFARGQKQETPKEAAAVLTEANGEPAVFIAATNLGNLAAVRVAWLSATASGQP
jgi:hypothetical protein